MQKDSDSRYKLPKFEAQINRAIGFVFYYRLVLVLLLIGITIFLDHKVWEMSKDEDKWKNLAVVFTGGSIIIGIFYSIINYEHNLSKFKHEKKLSKETLTFNTGCKMYDAEMIAHLRRLMLFHNAHKIDFDNNSFHNIYTSINASDELRASFVIVFNYFESISIGIEQGIMDEDFMKAFFKSVFRLNSVRFGSYINFIRESENTPNTFKKFTDLAQKWNNS